MHGKLGEQQMMLLGVQRWCDVAWCAAGARRGSNCVKCLDGWWYRHRGGADGPVSHPL